MSLLVDSGPLVAALDGDDDDHEVCVEFLRSVPKPIAVPVMCIAEVAHLVGRRGGWRAESLFLAAFATGEMVAEPFEPVDTERVLELVTTYRDLPLGTVDASIVAAAERLGIRRIATLDRKHFGVVRPKHIDAFELVP